MDAGAPEFNDLRTYGFEGGEVELLFAVVTEVALRDISELQPIGADDGFGLAMFHDDVIADLVVTVGVVTILIGGLEALVEFEIEDDEAEPEGSSAILIVSGEADDVGAGFEPNGFF